MVLSGFWRQLPFRWGPWFFICGFGDRRVCVAAIHQCLPLVIAGASLVVDIHHAVRSLMDLLVVLLSDRPVWLFSQSWA
jgi:hypothetical protein